MTDYLERILLARVYDVAIESPLEEAPNLSRRLGNTAAAEARGHAAGVLLQVARRLQQDGRADPRQLKRGVIAPRPATMRRAWPCRRRGWGAKAVIVMPATTPRIKIDAVTARAPSRARTAIPTTTPTSTPGRSNREERKLTFVHPYDDPDVIAGQGTIGMESCCASRARPSTLCSCRVGGGGLIAGIGSLHQAPAPGSPDHRRGTVDADAMTSRSRRRAHRSCRSGCSPTASR
jgi:threonine dehydratase